MYYYFNCRVLYSALSLLRWKTNQTLFFFTFLSFYMYYGNSSCWLIFLTIYSPISFSLSSLTHIFVVHQYADVSRLFISMLMYHECVPQYPQTCAEIVEVRLSQWSIFALAYWKLIVMDIIAKTSTWVLYNFWEGESEKEQARMGSVGLCVCVFLLPDQRLYKGNAPSKSADGLSSEVTGPEFTPSRSY